MIIHLKFFYHLQKWISNAEKNAYQRRRVFRYRMLPLSHPSYVPIQLKTKINANKIRSRAIVIGNFYLRVGP